MSIGVGETVAVGEAVVVGESVCVGDEVVGCDVVVLIIGHSSVELKEDNANVGSNVFHGDGL